MVFIHSLKKDELKELFLAANLAERLYLKRKSMKNPIEFQAKFYQVSTPTYRKWEKNEAFPNTSQLTFIFSYLELNEDDFLTSRHTETIKIRDALIKELYEVRDKIRAIEKVLKVAKWTEEDLQKGIITTRDFKGKEIDAEQALKDDLQKVQKRINFLEETLHSYKFTDIKVTNLMENDCSFATEFEDVDISESFQGKGDFLSKCIYLPSGLYVFSGTINFVVKFDTLIFEIINVRGDKVFTSKQYYESDSTNKFVVPVKIPAVGYHFIHIQTKSHWSLTYTDDVLSWNPDSNVALK